MDLYPFPIIETIFNSRAFKFDTIEVVSANFDKHIEFLNNYKIWIYPEFVLLDDLAHYVLASSWCQDK